MMHRPSLRGGMAAALLLMCGARLAGAALPPAAEREVEINAIIHSADVWQALNTAHPIDAIEVAGPDLYRVRAGGCQVMVRVADDPRAPDIPGPRRFLLIVVQRGCK